MTILLYALIVAAVGTAVALAVYVRRSGQLSRLFLALPRQTRRALIRRPSQLKLDGEIRTISYLACRIANAAEIEQAFRESPAQLIHLFEKRLGPLYEAVLEQGGTVERCGSAGFAAFWNAPLSDPDHAARALAAATRMIDICRNQNAQNATSTLRAASPAGPPLQLAIGLASGPATAGLFGGVYSVAGPCVPRAEELRSACDSYGFTALADAATAKDAPRFALLEIERPTGDNDTSASLYAVLGDAGLRASPTFRAVETFHARIFAAQAAQDHAEARRLIAQAAQLSGASPKLYDLYLARTVPEPSLKAAS